MCLIQVASSKEYGVYYYDDETSDTYYLNFGEMFGLSGELKSPLGIGWLIVLAAVLMSIVVYVSSVIYDVWNAMTYALLFAIAVLSIIAPYIYTMKGIQRYDREIRQRKRKIAISLESLLDEIKRGRKIYLICICSSVVFFCGACISLYLFFQIQSLAVAVFAIACLDFSVIPCFSLRPIAKLRVYRKLSKIVKTRGNII